MPARNHRYRDTCPISHVLRGIEDRVRTVAIVGARETRLTLPVCSCHMVAETTALAGMPRVHQNHWDASQACLVLAKAAQLGKGPSRHLGVLQLPEPNRTAAVLEVFRGKTTVGACGRRNERLTDTMLHIPTKASLPVCRALPGPSDVLRAFHVPLYEMDRPLQPLSPSCIPCTAGLNTSATVPGASTGGGKVDHAKIHTKDVRGGGQRAIQDLYDDQQKPLAIVTHDEMTLPGLMFHEACAMVHPNQKRAEHPPSQRQQTH